MYLFLGLIEESNASIIIKEEDGSDIKLALLKKPIALDNLSTIYEDIKTYRKKKKRRSKLNVSTVKKEGIVKKEESKLLNLTILKEPLSLDNIEWDDDHTITELPKCNSITFNVKTIAGAYHCGPLRRRANAIEYQVWKQNAITLFEFSHVYPFVYGSNSYKCFICSTPFLDVGLLRYHAVNSHTMGEMKRELNNRGRDKNLKVDVSSLDCKLCTCRPITLHNLKIHLKEIHGKQIDPNYQDNLVPFKLGGITFECQLCEESFLKIRLLIIHMNKHFNNYSCEICGSVYISLNLLKRHLQTHESGNFRCSECDKVFSNATKRAVHMRGVHLKQYPRRCPICPERFNSNYQRTKHLRIVHNQTTGLFRCETCSREYDLKSHLLLHIRSVHLQERNHECAQCQARFFSKELLNRHMVIHTGERNFKCEICGKAYARRKNLREHSRTHEVGPFGCSICGQSFIDHIALVSHINSIHGVV